MPMPTQRVLGSCFTQKSYNKPSARVVSLVHSWKVGWEQFVCVIQVLTGLTVMSLGSRWT